MSSTETASSGLPMSYAPLVVVTRSGIAESVHHGAIAVADADGKVIAWAGGPETVTYLRSSAKPLQVIPLLESGAADHFRLTPAEIAVAIGSHGGEPRHVEVVMSILSKIGLGEDHLMCGLHAPFHRPSAQRLEAAGVRPSVLHNNCSGKHAGMLALALFRGAPPEGYFRPEHSIQREILEAIAEFSGVEAGAIQIGVDGCSAPTFAVSLAAAATAYARLMEPDRYASARRYAARRAVEAMTAHPEMVAGEGRLDTALMAAGEGRLVAKAGAEGYYAAGFRRDGKGHGLALKISDGDDGRARTAAVLRALGELDLLPAPRLEALAREHVPPVVSRRGAVVGAVEARFRLERG
jgi:L-asparaginase II